MIENKSITSVMATDATITHRRRMQVYWDREQKYRDEVAARYDLIYFHICPGMTALSVALVVMAINLGMSIGRIYELNPQSWIVNDQTFHELGWKFSGGTPTGSVRYYPGGWSLVMIPPIVLVAMIIHTCFIHAEAIRNPNSCHYKIIPTIQAFLVGTLSLYLVRMIAHHGEKFMNEHHYWPMEAVSFAPAHSSQCQNLPHTTGSADLRWRHNHTLVGSLQQISDTEYFLVRHDQCLGQHDAVKLAVRVGQYLAPDWRSVVNWNWFCMALSVAALVWSWAKFCDSSMNHYTERGYLRYRSKDYEPNPMPNRNDTPEEEDDEECELTRPLLLSRTGAGSIQTKTGSIQTSHI